MIDKESYEILKQRIYKILEDNKELIQKDLTAKHLIRNLGQRMIYHAKKEEYMDYIRTEKAIQMYLKAYKKTELFTETGEQMFEYIAKLWLQCKN